MTAPDWNKQWGLPKLDGVPPGWKDSDPLHSIVDFLTVRTVAWNADNPTKFEVKLKLSPEQLNLIKTLGLGLYLAEYDQKEEVFLHWQWQVNVFLNGTKVDMVRQQYKSKIRGMPVVALNAANATYEGPASVHVVIDRTPGAKTSDKEERLPELSSIVLMLCKKLTPEEWIEKHWAGLPVQNFTVADENGTQDDDVQLGDHLENLSLQDPVSSTAIQYPVRGKKCTHMQMFCLQNLLNLALLTKGYKWECPCCKQEARVQNLVRDDRVAGIITKYRNQHTEIEIDMGQWKDPNYEPQPPATDKDKGPPVDEEILDSSSDDDQPPAKKAKPNTTTTTTTTTAKPVVKQQAEPADPASENMVAFLATAAKVRKGQRGHYESLYALPERPHLLLDQYPAPSNIREYIGGIFHLHPLQDYYGNCVEKLINKIENDAPAVPTFPEGAVKRLHLEFKLHSEYPLTKQRSGQLTKICDLLEKYYSGTIENVEASIPAFGAGKMVLWWKGPRIRVGQVRYSLANGQAEVWALIPWDLGKAQFLNPTRQKPCMPFRLFTDNWKCSVKTEMIPLKLLFTATGNWVLPNGGRPFSWPRFLCDLSPGPSNAATAKPKPKPKAAAPTSPTSSNKQ
eukprot:TRINITY_DN67949_c5_g5_i10.p1 TRINITY_DN67949_c5_g5~~TRINITY_DN67949_c5_g5_i10.p1  ORF type:complete len:633 (-),score=66.79 TRINITY_DN67949_c5_g5_i10:490-2355(-)